MQLEISVGGTFRMKLYCKAEAGYFVLLYFKQILKKGGKLCFLFKSIAKIGLRMVYLNNNNQCQVYDAFLHQTTESPGNIREHFCVRFVLVKVLKTKIKLN